MRIVFFFNGSLAAIFLMSAVRMLATGRIDPHYGYAGSLLNALTSSLFAALLSALAFGVAGLLERSAPARLACLKLGALAGVAGCFVAWTWMRVGQAGPARILACFMACAVLAALASRTPSASSRT
jgi:hypothetical protein